MSGMMNQPLRVDNFGASLSAAQWIGIIFVAWIIILVTSLSPHIWQAHVPLVQDDARHHVVWLRQLANPKLFADDPAAIFFMSQSPIAYQILYWPAVWLDIDVVRWHLLLLAPITCLLTTIAVYRFCTHLLPTRQMCGLVTLVFCASMADFAMQGLQRNFWLAIVLFAWTFYLERRILLIGVTFLFGANIYPVAAVVAGLGIFVHLVLSAVFRRGLDRRDIIVLLVAGCAGIAGLVPFLASSLDAGPTLLLEEARNHPTFQEHGRSHFFMPSLYDQVFCSRGGRASYVPICLKSAGQYATEATILVVIGTIFLGFLSLRLLFLRGEQDRSKRVTDVLTIALSMGIAGTFLYLISYMFAFRLYLPQRYSSQTIGLLFWFSYSLAITAVLMVAAHFLNRIRPILPKALLVVVWGVFILTARGDFGRVTDTERKISAYLRTTPESTVVAGFDSYLDNVPAFANRSSFVAIEFMIPFKSDYFDEMSQRVSALFQVLQDGTPNALASFAEKEGISYYLLRKEKTPLPRLWKSSFPFLETLEAKPLTSGLLDGVDCVVVTGRYRDLIDARCLARNN